MSKREAASVEPARNHISKADGGALNNWLSARLAAHAMREAIGRAGAAFDEVEDVIMGAAGLFEIA